MIHGNSTSTFDSEYSGERCSTYAESMARHLFEATRTYTVQCEAYPTSSPADHLMMPFNSWKDLAHSITELSYDAMTFHSIDMIMGMSDVRRTIEMVYQWERDNKGRMASAYIVYFVEANFSKHNLAAVNNFMLSASIDKLTEWSLVAILRSSFSARHQLPAWSGFLDAVRNRLKDSERVEKLLVGLNR